MRGGPVPQTSPLRTRQHPTAPKPAGDPYGSGTDPLPGFQGLNRANSQRRFPSANTGGEETRSAYAHYHRADRERPPSAGSFPNVVPERSRESVSPLRQTRSFPHHDELPQTRPPLSRTSSRYARTGGERTNLNTTPIGRSASVRNSPIDREWEERGPFGAKPVPEERNTRPRHRSHSPQTRPGNAKFEYNSETSSDEDAIPSPQERRKAPLKRPQTHTSTYSSDGPGLTGYFPNTNYTRIVEDGNKYDYPAPESKGTPIRKPFANLASAFDAHDPNANEPPFRSSSEEDISRHKYGSPLPPSSLPSWPTWAIPSSVCPKITLGRTPRQLTPNYWSPHSFMHYPLSQPLRGKVHIANRFYSSHPDQRGSSKVDTPWNPDEWHEHFDNHADLFKPPVPNSRDRKSPSKGFRTSRSGQGRPYAETKRDAATDDVDPGIIGGFRNIDPNSSQSKSSAFQAGKLAPNFLNQVNGSRRESKTATAEKPAETPGSDSVYSNGDRPTPDEMELDSPDLADTGSPGVSDATYNVTVEEERSPTSEQSNISPRQHIHRHHSDSAAQANGFNLSDLRQAGPFAPSKGGLEDVDALKDSIPFQSRPAEDLEALRRTNSSTFRELKLPRPPKCPTCPAELNQKSWGHYGDAMTIYMHDWNKFNAAMIEHFKARQEAVTHGMWRNWVCAQGDGATAEDFDKSNGSDRAGYQTYMTWLDDDRKCRTWWDVAFEEHRVCMEALGQVRKKVKELNARGSG